MADKKAPEIKIKYVKRKAGHGGAHGGAWKVAYADLVTAMMAFFLLMWLLGSTSKATKEGIAGYMKEGASFFNTERGQSILAEFGKGILPGTRGLDTQGDDGKGKEEEENDSEAERKSLEMLKKAIENAFDTDKLLVAFKDQISIDFTEEGMRIQIKDKGDQALFDSGSDRMKPYAMSILREISKELAKMKNHIVVGGHTDSIPYIGTGYTNWDLSTSRANSALRAILSTDFPQGQVKRVTGYAETLPMESLDPKDPQNRRISIIVLSSYYEARQAELNKSVGSRPTSSSSKTR
ncbi:MAG: OmpA family protein [Holophagales bacterium]|jgi:chemotaxis protein MotB|nr:OmpA family protein [Holophagales bacterium]